MENKKENKNEGRKVEFAFGLLNYIIMGIGLVMLFIGYVLLTGGGSDDPNVFNAEMFNARRMYVAPILIVLGLVVEIVAIMVSPKCCCKKNKKEEE